MTGTMMNDAQAHPPVNAGAEAKTGATGRGETRETRPLAGGADGGLAMLRELLDDLPGFVWMPQDGDHMAYANRSLLAFAGIERADDFNAVWFDRVHPDDRDAALEAIQIAYWQRRPYQTTYRFRAANGEYHWLQQTAVPRLNGDGSLRCFICAGTDITAIKQAEIAEDDARQRAEEANALKTRFFAHVSHELRTPLNGILGMLQILAAGPLDDEQRSQVAVATHSGNVLLRLIDDLLAFTRSDPAERAEPAVLFDITTLVEATVVRHAPVAAGRGYSLEFDSQLARPAVMLGTARELTRLLEHLLANALKFTVDGFVRVHLCDAARSGWVRLEVEDTGIGIDAERVRELREAVGGANSLAARRATGGGVGLALASKAARALGGWLGLESTEGVGSRFWVELPLAEVSIAGDAEADAASGCLPFEPVSAVRSREIEALCGRGGYRELMGAFIEQAAHHVEDLAAAALPEQAECAALELETASVNVGAVMLAAACAAYRVAPAGDRAGALALIRSAYASTAARIEPERRPGMVATERDTVAPPLGA